MPFIRAASTIAVLVIASMATFAAARQPLAATPLGPARSKAIDAFITSEMKRQQIPGVAVGIFSHGTLLLAKGTDSRTSSTVCR